MVEFFTRQLKEGSRQIDAKSALTSPCDGKVLSCGAIDEYGYVEQIKGPVFEWKLLLYRFIGKRVTQLRNRQQLVLRRLSFKSHQTGTLGRFVASQSSYFSLAIPDLIIKISYKIKI